MSVDLQYIQEGINEAKINDVEGCINYIDGYFNVVTWSIEKEEWLNMSMEEKKVFCETLMKSN